MASYWFAIKRDSISVIIIIIIIIIIHSILTVGIQLESVWQQLFFGLQDFSEFSIGS